MYLALHIQFNFLDLPSSVCEDAPINSKLIDSLSDKQAIFYQSTMKANPDWFYLLKYMNFFDLTVLISLGPYSEAVTDLFQQWHKGTI